MNLVKSHDTAYERYEQLLLDRDQYEKEAGSTWTAYIQLFGALMTEVFEEKIECIRLKKMISYCQAAANKGKSVSQEAMQEYIEGEMAEYYSQLRKMIDDNERCRKLAPDSPYTVNRVKKIYRRIAKLLHPDINPETDRNDRLRELWERTVISYHHNDLKGITELEVLIGKALAEAGDKDVRIEIPDIEDKITELEAEIERIRHTEPYTHRYLIEDQIAVDKKKKELDEELTTYKKYHEELDGVFNELISGGGFSFVWQMKLN